MNQDFGLLATPANARRLLLLHQICDMDIPDAIRVLATQDTVSSEQFDPLVCPHNTVKQTITQFLLDCKLRNIIQANYHPEFNPLALLYAVRLANPEHIIIVGTKERWYPAITALSLHKITHLLPSLSLSNEELDRYRRNSVLVIDVMITSLRNMIRTYSREFAQTIIYEGVSDMSLLTHWSIWARTLFPTMPHPLYVRVVKDIPSRWHNLELAAFAPFYNTCIFPHLISAPNIIKYLDDSNIIGNLTYHRGKLLS